MKSRLRAALCAAVVAAAGCGHPVEPDDASLTGAWRGETAYGGRAVHVDVVLVERDGHVRGSGGMTFGTEFAVSMSVEGDRDREFVVLVWWIEDVYRVVLSGQVGDRGRTLSGVLRGSGFGGEEVVLARDRKN